jgi:peptide/nickel transport system substrate-binding protein
MSGKVLKHALLALTLVGFLTGPALADKSTLVIAWYASVKSLDPAIATSATERQKILLVNERLLRYDRQGNLKPHLAKSWKASGDMKTYTFYLRKGINFTDGAPFNAQAVKFTFERTMSIGAGPSKVFKNVESIETPDEHTVVIKLKEPDALFVPVSIATHFGNQILSPKTIKANATNDDPWAQKWAGGNLVGTGPYKLLKFDPSLHAVLERNPDYWMGWKDKYIETVVIKPVREYNTRKTMLLMGEADIISDMSPLDREQLEATKGVHVKPIRTTHTNYYFFNHLFKPFKDGRIREAMALAYDYDAAVKMSRGTVTLIRGPFPASFLGHDSSIPVGQRDLEKAKKLVAEAGVKPGKLKVRLMYFTGNDFRRRIAELFRSNMADIGIEVTLLPREWVQLKAQAFDPKTRPELVHYETWPAIIDPMDILQRHFITGATLDCASYTNPEVNKIANELRGTADLERRKELSKKAQNIIYNDHPALFLWTSTDLEGVRTRVRGYEPYPAYSGYYDVHEMHLEN